MTEASNVPLGIITRFGIGIFDESWFEHRFALFRALTLPSVLNQSSRDFVWLLCVDQEMPPGLDMVLRMIGLGRIPHETRGLALELGTTEPLGVAPREDEANVRALVRVRGKPLPRSIARFEHSKTGGRECASRLAEESARSELHGHDRNLAPASAGMGS